MHHTQHCLQYPFAVQQLCRIQQLKIFPLSVGDATRDNRWGNINDGCSSQTEESKTWVEIGWGKTTQRWGVGNGNKPNLSTAHLCSELSNKSFLLLFWSRRAFRPNGWACVCVSVCAGCGVRLHSHVYVHACLYCLCVCEGQTQLSPSPGIC